MLGELRLNPHRSAAQFGTPGRGKSARGRLVRFSPNVSTAFAEGPRPRSTGADISFASLSSAHKEMAV